MYIHILTNSTTELATQPYYFYAFMCVTFVHLSECSCLYSVSHEAVY